MSINEQTKKQLDDALIESLLSEALKPASHHYQQAQLAELLDATQPTDLGLTDSVDDNASDQSEQIRPTIRTNRRILQRWQIWLTTAAAVLLGFVLVNSWNNSQTAYASLQKIINSKPIHRSYSVAMQNQLPVWGERSIRTNLFLNDNDQFVIEHPGWKGFGPIWIGGGRNERWIVPPRGPSIVGNESLIGKWLDKRDLPSPYLHLSTILARMQQAYDLKQFPNERSPSENLTLSTECVHLLGTRKHVDGKLPETIEVWADAESGVAHQVVLRWQRPATERGPLSWTITLSSLDDLPDQFFTLQNHQSFNKKVLRVDSDSDFVKIENESPL